VVAFEVACKTQNDKEIYSATFVTGGGTRAVAPKTAVESSGLRA